MPCRIPLWLVALAILVQASAEADESSEIAGAERRTKVRARVSAATVETQEESTTAVPDTVELPPNWRPGSVIEPPPIPPVHVLQEGTGICESCVHGHGRACRNGCRPSSMMSSHWHQVTKPHLQRSHWGYCDLFCERPFGTLVRAHMNTQVLNGLADQMFLYAYDFFDESEGNAAHLKPRGDYQLEKVAHLLKFNLGPIIIEQTAGNPELDEQRRQHVLEQLERLNVPFVPEQVVIGRAPRPMLSGVEALMIQGNNENLINSRGGSGGTGSSGSSTILAVPVTGGSGR